MLLVVFLLLAPLADENGYLRHVTIASKCIHLQRIETLSHLMLVYRPAIETLVTCLQREYTCLQRSDTVILSLILFLFGQLGCTCTFTCFQLHKRACYRIVCKQCRYSETLGKCYIRSQGLEGELIFATTA